MRILAIRGRNLASISGDFAIDFAAEPLASSGIFAITGPTGAGKSTLLDAVCLALFNDIPRLKAAPASGRIGESEEAGLSLRDPRAILRHGTGDGFAEVDFAMPGGATYRARWAVKRARGRADGRLQNQDHSFERLDTAQRMGGTRTETLAAIREVIGLSAEQFGRAVLLAQGDFEAFIRADANDRAVLLERLTGSEIYTALGQRAYDKAKALETGLEAIRARIHAQNGLDDAARAEAETALATAQGAEADAARHLETLHAAARWEERGLALAGQVAAARAALEDSEAQDAAAAPRRDALIRDRAAMAHAPAWRELATAAARREETAREARDAARSLATAREAESIALAAQAQAQAAALAARNESARAAPSLDAARALDIRVTDAAHRLGEARGRADKAQTLLAQAEQAASDATRAHQEAAAALATVERWLGDHGALGDLATRESELAAHLADHARLAAAIADGEGRRGTCEAAEQAALARWARAQDNLAAAQTALGEAESRRAEAQAALPPESRMADLGEERDALTRLEGLVATLGAADGALAAADAALSRTRAGEAETQGLLATLATRQAALAAQLPGLAARAADARRELDLLRAAATDAAEAMRADLSPGEPCPVCGGLDHQLDRFEGKLGEHLRAREAAAGELANEHGACERALIGIAAEHKATLDRAAHLAREAAEQARLLDTAMHTRDQALARIGVAAHALGLPPAPAALPDALAGRQRGVSAALATIAAARTAAQTAMAEADAARERLDTARGEHDAARDALAIHANALSELNRELQAQASEAERHALILDRWLAPADDWRALADPRRWLGERAQQWREREAERARLGAALPGLRDAQTRADAQLDQCRAQAQELAATLATAGEAHAALAGERATLLDGESVAAVEQRLAAARETADTAHDEAAKAREAASNGLSAAQAHHAACARAEAQALADHAAREQRFAAELASAGLAPEDIARVASAGQAALDAQGDALAALERAVSTARAVLGEREGDLAAHKAQARPALAGEDLAGEELAGEDLRNAIAAATAARDDAAARRGDAELVLRQDDAVRERTAQLRAELERETAAADIWLRLSALIGDRTGATFRRFAQGLTLDRLLEHANARLSDLKPRFTLERAPGGDMLIQVLDNDMGGQIRGLHNLSGGERFLVSLALALGLAEMSSAGGVKIESLFIDEGFGALDPASLGQAVALLEHLHATGRRVGVISHVEELKERIPVKIEVTPTGRGTSTIAVVAG